LTCSAAGILDIREACIVERISSGTELIAMARKKSVWLLDEGRTPQVAAFLNHTP